MSRLSGNLRFSSREQSAGCVLAYGWHGERVGLCQGFVALVIGELKLLGAGIDGLREAKTLEVAEGLGIHLSRIGASASILYLRCLSITDELTGDKQAILQGIARQHDLLKSAVSRLRELPQSGLVSFAVEPVVLAADGVVTRAMAMLASEESASV